MNYLIAICLSHNNKLVLVIIKTSRLYKKGTLNKCGILLTTVSIQIRLKDRRLNRYWLMIGIPSLSTHKYLNVIEWIEFWMNVSQWIVVLKKIQICQRNLINLLKKWARYEGFDKLYHQVFRFNQFSLFIQNWLSEVLK